MGRYTGCENYRIPVKFIYSFRSRRVRCCPRRSLIIISSLASAIVGAAMQGHAPSRDHVRAFLTLPPKQVEPGCEAPLHVGCGQLTVRSSSHACRLRCRRAHCNSHQLEAWFVHIPGLRSFFPPLYFFSPGYVAVSSSGRRYYADNPVVSFEHLTAVSKKKRKTIKGYVPEGERSDPARARPLHLQARTWAVVVYCRLVHYI